MNSKRSMWKLLVSVACVGLFVTNCTIKTDSDDDSNGCTPGNKKECNACNGVTGSQTCQDDGSYGECVCPGSSNAGASSGGASSGGSSSGGKSSTAGYGGWVSTDGGASSGAGEGGAGGEGATIDPTDCAGCLYQKCALEWDQCVAEDEKNPETPGKYCLSSKLDGSGQIEKVLGCIEDARANGLVKRDAVRACGTTLGQNADPNAFSWPPDDMTAVTAQVLNCMADSPTELNPGTWADSTNIPPSGSPKPWLDDTCAKLACTSATN
ncbi:MAG TPA: hypothetical protein VHM25_07800 [Polyangiaceae bacterium]|jgi:hypothetical protein|nr:hypothetical protein [Polyangiaceae bacterium]